MHKVILAITVLAIVVALMILIQMRSQAFEKWANLYEVCVQEKYGMTPTEWYQQNGDYPECDVKIKK